MEVKIGIKRIVVILTFLLLAACAPLRPPANQPTQQLTEAPTSTPMPSGVPEEALKNGAYQIDGQSVTLVNGTAENEAAPGAASKQVTRYYGDAVDLDLNSDGLTDAVFLLQQETGGSGTFFFVTAALQTPDGFVGTNAVFLGDRIAPQSVSVDPKNPSQCLVNYLDRSPGEPMSSSPTMPVFKAFQLVNGVLVEAAAPPSTAP